MRRCRAEHNRQYNDVEMNLLYDAALFQFVQGGSKAGGDGGVVRISSVGNEDAVKKTAEIDCIVQPAPERVALYRKYYPLYIEIHDDLVHTYRKYEDE